MLPWQDQPSITHHGLSNNPKAFAPLFRNFLSKKDKERVAGIRVALVLTTISLLRRLGHALGCAPCTGFMPISHMLDAYAQTFSEEIFVFHHQTLNFSGHMLPTCVKYDRWGEKKTHNDKKTPKHNVDSFTQDWLVQFPITKSALTLTLHSPPPPKYMRDRHPLKRWNINDFPKLGAIKFIDLLSLVSISCYSVSSTFSSHKWRLTFQSSAAWTMCVLMQFIPLRECWKPKKFMPFCVGKGQSTRAKHSNECSSRCNSHDVHEVLRRPGASSFTSAGIVHSLEEYIIQTTQHFRSTHKHPLRRWLCNSLVIRFGFNNDLILSPLIRRNNPRPASSRSHQSSNDSLEIVCHWISCLINPWPRCPWSWTA